MIIMIMMMIMMWGNKQRKRKKKKKKRGGVEAGPARRAVALTSTTSVPAFWMRTVRASASSAVNFTVGLVRERRGRMVAPACPPITGTSTSISRKFFFSATNVFDRTTSSVVTPNSFLGSYTPLAFRISAAMGTVEFTGLLMMLINACPRK